MRASDVYIVLPALLNLSDQLAHLLLLFGRERLRGETDRDNNRRDGLNIVLFFLIGTPRFDMIPVCMNPLNNQ